MYHNAGVKANLGDLEKFDEEGNVKNRVKLYNKQLKREIDRHIKAMHDAYTQMKEEGMDMKTDVFEDLILQYLNPIQELRSSSKDTFYERFVRYVETAHRDGIVGDSRYKHFLVQVGKMYRFLTIKGLTEISPKEFDEELLMQFRQFLFDEYKLVPKYKKVYKDVKPRFIPTERLSANTVTTQLKIWQTFFNELENRDEINKSPFRKLGTEKRKAVMHAMYDDPVFLRWDELQKVINAEVPETLSTARDAFILQCAIGCRIGDFQKMTMDNVAVSEEGIPYVHYLPTKTAGSQDSNYEIETPLVRYAFDIIKKTNFNLPILNYAYGVNGYNVKIKELMKTCEITRKVKIYNESKRDNDYIPLNEVASTKLCRKTHVDIMNKVQVNIYAAGLHREGSGAVHRYTKMELADHFALMNVAFGQEDYRVDKDLNIIEMESAQK